MDPASLSIAVVGMFLTCCKGYHILSDARRAPRDAEDAARRVGIESAVFASWGEHFEIRREVAKQRASEKLKFYLRSEQTRIAVSDALIAILETFIDIERLKTEYGVFFYSEPDKPDSQPDMIDEDWEEIGVCYLLSLCGAFCAVRYSHITERSQSKI